PHYRITKKGPGLFFHRMARKTRPAPLLSLLLSLVVAATLHAQRSYFREGSFAPQYAPPEMPDADFYACRLEYSRVRFEAMGIGWNTDYPYSERNLMIRLSELT